MYAIMKGSQGGSFPLGGFESRKVSYLQDVFLADLCIVSNMNKNFDVLFVNIFFQ